MFSFFKKKIIIPHIRLVGIIGTAGRFKQGIDFSGQQEIIKKAFSFKKAKSIAISINSPGGSPVQSHLIYKFIREQAKKNKKKVIIFAEDVAASGGYYIASAGDVVFAEAGTITGSIGVIGGKLVLKSFYRKIGLNKELFRRGNRSGLFSDCEPFAEEDRERMGSVIEDFYKAFVQNVATCRSLSYETVDESAQGRVWTGRHNGLPTIRICNDLTIKRNAS